MSEEQLWFEGGKLWLQATWGIDGIKNERIPSILKSPPARCSSGMRYIKRKNIFVANMRTPAISNFLRSGEHFSITASQRLFPFPAKHFIFKNRDEGILRTDKTKKQEKQVKNRKPEWRIHGFEADIQLHISHKTWGGKFNVRVKRANEQSFVQRTVQRNTVSQNRHRQNSNGPRENLIQKMIFSREKRNQSSHRNIGVVWWDFGQHAHGCGDFEPSSLVCVRFHLTRFKLDLSVAEIDLQWRKIQMKVQTIRTVFVWSVFFFFSRVHRFNISRFCSPDIHLPLFCRRIILHRCFQIHAHFGSLRARLSEDRLSLQFPSSFAHSCYAGYNLSQLAGNEVFPPQHLKLDRGWPLLFKPIIESHIWARCSVLLLFIQVHKSLSSLHAQHQRQVAEMRQQKRTKQCNRYCQPGG